MRVAWTPAIAALTLGCFLVLAGCSSDAVDSVVSSFSSISVSPNSQIEPSAGWNQAPDSSVTPDSELSVSDVDGILRLTATDPSASVADACTGDQLEFALGPADAAAGHRYSSLVATNVSSASCSLVGSPGIGVRGEWGNTFLLDASHRNIDPNSTPSSGDVVVVTLGAGESAAADLEWTGSLRGAEDEPLSTFVVQLTSDQHAILFAPPDADDVASGSSDAATSADDGVALTRDTVDIGMFTTVRVGWWQHS